MKRRLPAAESSEFALGKSTTNCDQARWSQLLPDWECLGGLPIVAIYRKMRPTQSRINALLQHLTKEFRAYDNVIGAAN